MSFYLHYLCLFAYSSVQHIVFCFCFIFLLYFMWPVSLDCPFVIASLVFSNVYLLSIKETENILSMILYIFRLIFTRDNINYQDIIVI